ncbi:acetoacetate decarboxylase family protein [Rhodococcus sp. NPDC058521]|uniref:acetoacetate decarboxylase family protein n=1 Tax=Rhodococcus sp. NPDC058521 TaxID=3346536 RepID=UPI00365809E7
MTAHEVLGRTVNTPVQVRKASAFVAAFTVPSDRAQSTIDYSGLRVLEYREGRGICMLVFVDYVDGDLGRYEEFGVVFMVRDRGRSSRGAFIHRLPVDGDFTLAAGRGIWGFPKTLATFDTDHDSSTKRASLSVDGAAVLDLEVKPGIAVPGRRTEAVAYSHLGGVTRHTPWDMTPTGVRARPGGATLRLGSHPLAEELRSLRLSRRALFTTSVRNIAMSFGDANDL